jgi:hypothetical protein
MISAKGRGSGYVEEQSHRGADDWGAKAAGANLLRIVVVGVSAVASSKKPSNIPPVFSPFANPFILRHRPVEEHDWKRRWD